MRAHGAEQGRRLKEEQARRSALQGELDEVKEKLREKAAPAVDADDEDEDEDEFEDAEEAYPAPARVAAAAGAPSPGSSGAQSTTSS